MGNNFGNGAIYISGARQINSFGNTWHVNAGPYVTHASSKVSSAGDVFSYGRWNVTAGTLIQQNAATTPSTPALSVGTKTGANEIGRFETNGADASLSFRNTSSIPSDWRLMFPGTGTGTPAAPGLPL